MSRAWSSCKSGVDVVHLLDARKRRRGTDIWKFEKTSSMDVLKTYALKRSLHMNYHPIRGCHLVVWETNPAFDHHSSSPVIFCMTGARKYWSMYQRKGWREVWWEHVELRCETGHVWELALAKAGHYTFESSDP